MRAHRLLFALACAVPCRAALAQPAPPVADKIDAKSLMQSGLKLYAAQDYLGALAVFRTAYTRFPSAKILINIGTTLIKLGRKADAANTYQRYLDAPDADPAKRAEVTRAIAELDQAVGRLELTVTPADAELQFNDEDWTPASTARRYRVAPGTMTVRARCPRYKPDERQVRVTAGQTVPIAFTLDEIPAPVAAVASAPVDGGVRASVIPEPPPSKIGVTAIAHLDVLHGGGAGLVGATFDVTGRLQAQAAAIVGPSYGGYLGAAFALRGGKLRPVISAGVPMFMSNGARVGIRGAGGFDLAVSRHLAVMVELGVEHMLNAESDVQHRTLLIPAVGAVGHL
jgi:hypothetical protein